MKLLRLSLAATVLAILALPAAAADKPVAFGLQANYGDTADFGLGGRVFVSLDDKVKNLDLVGTVDIFFPNEETDPMGVFTVSNDYMSFGVNGIYNFHLKTSSAVPYAGAGLNLARYKGAFGADWTVLGAEEGDVDEWETSTTTIGINLIAGITLKERYFLETRLELNEIGLFVVSAGIRF